MTGYDKQGNILGLSRYGQTGTSTYGVIDNLVLSYNGNQLKAIKDNATNTVYGNGFEFKDGTSTDKEYTYDENGNLTKDLNKKITLIQYNWLDLPSKVQFEGGNSIVNLYAANGTKFRTTRVTGSNTITTDFCNNAIYENGVLVKVLTQDGYMMVKDTKPHYFIQDHLGNNRVVVDKDGKVEETNHYYPFGGVFTSSTNIQPYKYNGKELDRSNGLDWYDYGARQYDAAIGRWHTVDPMAEDYFKYSTYSYGLNSPINNIDINGCFSTKFGAWLYRLFNGGGQILKDVGGEYFVSEKVNNLGNEPGITVNRYFDWNGRNKGKNIDLAKQWSAYIADIKFQEVCNTHGMEYIKTNNRSEAIRSIIQPMTLTILPNPILKNNLFHSVFPRNIKWEYGSFKSTTKWTSQMNKRGWTESQITEAINMGKKYKDINNVNKGHKASRYVHPKTGRSVVIDDITHELLQVGGNGFKWTD